MSEKEKPESGFVNLPSPEREDPASRGATSQEKDPGAKNAGNDKPGDGKTSARGEDGLSISPSEPDGGASELDAGDDANASKVLEM